MCQCMQTTIPTIFITNKRQSLKAIISNKLIGFFFLNLSTHEQTINTHIIN